MTFSENLNRICYARGTTASAVLKEMGVSTSKVTMWNNGSLPKQEMLIKLAHTLNCSVMEFFRDDIAVENQGVNDLILDDDERDVIRLFRLLSRKERHEFMVRCYAYEKQMMERE